VKNRLEFEGGLEKRKGKGGKEEKKIPQKKSTRTGKNFRGGGGGRIFLAGQNIYPSVNICNLLSKLIFF